jgi:hypothetical protein
MAAALPHLYRTGSAKKAPELRRFTHSSLACGYKITLYSPHVMRVSTAISGNSSAIRRFPACPRQVAPRRFSGVLPTRTRPSLFVG